MRRRVVIRREYRPGGPLVASQRMKFRGVIYDKGAPLPADQLTPRRHRQFWMTRKADHAPIVEEPMKTATADLDLDRMSPERLAELEAATAPPESASMRFTSDEERATTLDEVEQAAPRAEPPRLVNAGRPRRR